MVAATYSDFLDAPPSSTSLAYWSGRVSSGSSSQASFVAYVAGSKASVIEQVSWLYYRILRRAPEGQSLHARVVAIQDHTGTVAGNAAQLYASGEYFVASGGTTGTWVQALYQSILGRSPSALAASARAAQVAAKGRQYVATQLYTSLEARSRRVRALYQRLLERAPSPDRLAHWEAVDATPAGDVAVATGLADSAEYASVAQHRSILAIGTPYLTAITVGQPAGVLATETANGGSGPYHWTLLGLPPSLHATQSAGAAQISGDLSAGPASGPYPVVSIVTDAFGATNVVTKHLSLVLPPGDEPITFPNPSSSGYPNDPVYGAYRVGTPVSDHLTIKGGVAPYTVTFTGTLPPGLSLSTDGSITGTPTSAGVGDLEVTVTDALHSTATHLVWVHSEAPATQPLESVTDVLGAASGACAIAGGQVDCWGEHVSSNPYPGETDYPTAVPGLANATKLAYGVADERSSWSTDICAITTGTTVYCGFGPGRSGATPTLVAGLTGVVDVETNQELPFDDPTTPTTDDRLGTACALTNTGHVLCWGNNYRGELGAGLDPTTTAKSDTAVDTGLSGISRLYPVGNTFCALGSGHLWCWGAEGGLNLTEADAPVEVPGLSSVTWFSGPRDTSMSSGACAVDSGHLWCWGANISGEVGNGTNSPQLTPYEVPGLTNVTNVSASVDGTCAIATVASTPGTLECWGSVWSATGPALTQPTPQVVPGLTNVSDVDSNGHQICAIADPSNTAYCWNSTWNGDGTDQGTATPVSTHLTGAAAIHAISDTFDVCVEKNDGTWWCWGRDPAAVGVGLGDYFSPTELVDAESATPLTAVTELQGPYPYAISNGGQLRGWNDDHYAQLGDGQWGSAAPTALRPQRI
jgi:hypothetical protein